MGAVPSRETHRRGLFSVQQGSGGTIKKQDIVLIPLTKEFFPSPDCPLFVQFHKVRCDAAVNFYFRRPGDPGDLSRIPNYAQSYLGAGEGEELAARRKKEKKERERAATMRGVDSLSDFPAPPEDAGAAGEEDEEDESYPSREALYHGVIDRVEEALFDTDAEMREAHQRSQVYPQAQGRHRRRVLPILCAVAFRYDPSKIAATSSGQQTGSMHQMITENGVYLFGSIINIVGCFGFVSMQEEVEAIASQSQQQVPQGVPSSLNRTPTSPTSRGRFSHDPYSLGSSQGSSARTPVMAGSMGQDGGPRLAPNLMKGGSGKEGGRSWTLPPPVAAPLAAMVFLTKSAGEQNLGRVTHIAASTYYFQLIQAGVIPRPPAPGEAVPPAWTGGAPAPAPPYAANPPPYSSPAHMLQPPPHVSPLMPGFPLPPMETFSFSSLLTNIPILSFMFEMKCRWGHLGILKETPTSNASMNSSFASSSMGPAPLRPSVTGARGPGSMMENHSSGGLSVVDRSGGQNVTDEMEMWITSDLMVHGRISKDLAERLCWSLAERPEVMNERVTQLPSEDEGYWRYRGLVDRTHPPPLPMPGQLVTIHPKDVYVVGTDVLPGFDEGDILRFDAERLVWFADHAIPLEGVVLAAMRPYCKQAREAPPTDPAWVTRLVPADEVPAEEDEDTYPLPPPTAEEEAAMAADPTLRRVHEHVGIFYVYRFERDGTSFYHGTVPNFANPNKKKSAAAPAPAAVKGAEPASAAKTKEVEAGVEDGQGRAHTSTPLVAPSHTPAPQQQPQPTPPLQTQQSSSSSNTKPSIRVPSSIAGALFSLLPSSAAGTGSTTDATTPSKQKDGATGAPATPAAATTTNNSSSNNNSTSTTTASSTSAEPAPYLTSRVTSTALDAARRWMQNIYSYAYGVETTSQTGNTPPHSRGMRTPATGSTHSGGVRQASRHYHAAVSPVAAHGPTYPATPAPGGPTYPSYTPQQPPPPQQPQSPCSPNTAGGAVPVPPPMYSGGWQPSPSFRPASPTQRADHNGGGGGISVTVKHSRSVRPASAAVAPPPPYASHLQQQQQQAQSQPPLPQDSGSYVWDWRKLPNHAQQQ